MSKGKFAGVGRLLASSGISAVDGRLFIRRRDGSALCLPNKGVPTRQSWRFYIHFYAMPDRPLGAELVRGIVAPKLNVVGGKFYITVSNVGHDVRWLKADQPAGPYTDGWDSALQGYQNPLNQSFGPGDGMFFTDADGKIYLVWGPGRHKLLPLFDLPIADLSICKGGDDAWYLTGTVGSQIRNQKSAINNPADFQKNDGIYL